MDDPDDWRGWVGGKYDNRYDGVGHNPNSKHSGNKTKPVMVGIVFVLIVGFGFFLWYQGFFDTTIQNAPKIIQDASNTAKNITKETVSKIREIIDQQPVLIKSQLPAGLIDDTAGIPDTISEQIAPVEPLPIDDTAGIPDTISEQIAPVEPLPIDDTAGIPDTISEQIAPVEPLPIDDTAGIPDTISEQIAPVEPLPIDDTAGIPDTISEQIAPVEPLPIDDTAGIPDTISEQIAPVEPTTTDDIVDDTAGIPKTVQENNPVNNKPVIDAGELERQVHSLTNQYRIQNDLKALSWDGQLSDVARKHSRDMATRDYFSHQTPEGYDPTDRGTSVGYQCRKIVGNLIYSGIAENIFQNNLYDTFWHVNGIPTSYDWNSLDDLTKSTVDGWMDSPGHRKNILTATYDREGIGVVISSDDKVYITQNFC